MYARTVKKQMEVQSDQTYTSNTQPNPISVGQVTPLVLKLFTQGRPPMIGWDDSEKMGKKNNSQEDDNLPTGGETQSSSASS
jgi:hypothetical protein